MDLLNTVAEILGVKSGDPHAHLIGLAQDVNDDPRNDAKAGLLYDALKDAGIDVPTNDAGTHTHPDVPAGAWRGYSSLPEHVRIGIGSGIRLRNRAEGLERLQNRIGNLQQEPGGPPELALHRQAAAYARLIGDYNLADSHDEAAENGHYPYPGRDSHFWLDAGGMFGGVNPGASHIRSEIHQHLPTENATVSEAGTIHYHTPRDAWDAYHEAFRRHLESQQNQS